MLLWVKSCGAVWSKTEIFAHSQKNSKNLQKGRFLFQNGARLFRLDFLKAFLIQDLVSDTISKEIFSSLDTEKSAFYSTSYEANFKRSGIATGFDFLIPKSTTISLTRDIRSAGSTSDMYQARLKTNNTAVNLFGKRGTHPLFSWYEQDEFSSSLSVSTKIPKESPSDWSWQICCYCAEV